MREISPEERLVNALIASTAKEYRRALKADNQGKIAECERFFRSEWFEFLSDANGEYLIERIRKEVKEKSK